ncbi:MAG: restriction endonuclease [Candidatus Thermoplasmatota archaeon]|nr:restriction endonuclease [Candidatus Thermoplasmatota archaeon]
MNPKQESLITMGDNAFNNGKYLDALNFYNQGLQQDTTNTLILSKIGNVYYIMQIYPTSITFYEEALTISNAFTIIYEYALGPMQPPDLYMLQKNLQDQYQVDIIIEGLEYVISNIQQEIQEKPPSPSLDIRQAQPWENLAVSLFRQAGIPFPGEIFDVVHQIKHILPDTNPGIHEMILSKRMSWAQFEIFLQNFFEKKGYQVIRTKKSHDDGCDLILKKSEENIVVQAKKRKATIGVKAVQEIYAAKSFYEANNAILIVTSRFSKPALKLADKIGVECWDWQRLLQELQKT